MPLYSFKEYKLMKDKKTIQTYVNNFRRRLSPYLKPGIGLVSNIHPADEGGAIIEFSIGPSIENDDNYQVTTTTVSGALSTIPQHAFGGNLDGFKFSGTNLIMEPNRIILIKDDSPSEWSDEAAKTDVSKILPKSSGGSK
jgi:hypothetical protein